MKWNPKNDFKDWRRNWGLWYDALQSIRKIGNNYNWGKLRRLAMYAYWIFDVGVNVLTGGDPEESISSRVYKDRDAVLGRMILQYVEFVSDDEQHGEKAFNQLFGEGGSVSNRELSIWGQIVLLAAVAAGLLVSIHWEGIVIGLVAGVFITRTVVIVNKIILKRKLRRSG
jgi:hypothetical protein